jgi:hypothetical protein
VIGRIGESVHVDVVALRVIDLTHPRVQLVIGDAAPGENKLEKLVFNNYYVLFTKICFYGKKLCKKI